MVRTKQGGSVLTFIIGGVFLIILLVGGIYWISQQNRSNNAPLPTPQAPIEPAPRPSNEPMNPDRTHQQRDNAESTPPQLPSNGQPTASELPTTGPREMLTSSFIFALLCGVAISYVRSRRETASL